ncbi:MAG: phosphoglucomutase [Ignavibacteriales bacterium]|nr:phosphoglucomutase [Ignavibacteriales bacterium]
MSKNNIKLGTDGWRALVGDVFNEHNVQRIAEAFAKHLNSRSSSEHTVAVGYDGRVDSKRSAELFSHILSANNIHVILSDRIIPTPVLSYTTKHLNCSAGIMITASHNPSTYNGIKFKATYGGPLTGEETKHISQLLSDDLENKQNDAFIVKKNFLDDYLTHINTMIDFNSLKSFAADPRNTASVIIDSMGGAGQTILEDILVQHGWRAQTIFGSPEQNFYDRNPEPIEKNVEPLKYNVSVTDSILGIATDGDADRCAVVFPDGRWMSVQQTILILQWHLYHYKKMKGAVVKSVPVTDKVRLFAEKWNLPFYDVNVGYKNITDIMLKTDFLFGVEESGGFGIQGHLPERDGIVSGLLFCELLAKSGKSLYEIWDEIKMEVGDLFYKRIDLEMGDRDRVEILHRCELFHPSKNLEEFFVHRTRKLYDDDVLTGIKFSFGDSRWLLIRSSHTEPMIRIYAEGRSEDEVERLLREGRRLVQY